MSRCRKTMAEQTYRSPSKRSKPGRGLRRPQYNEITPNPNSKTRSLLVCGLLHSRGPPGIAFCLHVGVFLAGRFKAFLMKSSGFKKPLQIKGKKGKSVVKQARQFTAVGWTSNSSAAWLLNQEGSRSGGQARESFHQPPCPSSSSPLRGAPF